MGPDAADVRRRGRPHRRRARHSSPGAPICAPPARSSTSTPATRRTAPRAARATRASPPCSVSAPPPWPDCRQRRATGGARRTRSLDDGNEPEPLGYAELVGAHGGLTRAAAGGARGHDDDGDGAARRRRGHQPGERRRPHQPAADGDDQRPLRSRRAAAGRGADVTLASDAGATPLYGVAPASLAISRRRRAPAARSPGRSGR